jgi:hypothetical protein
VETKDKGKEAQRRREGEEEELHSTHSPSLNVEEENPFAQAS